MALRSPLAIDERYRKDAIPITSQLPVEGWHEALGVPTMADLRAECSMDPRITTRCISCPPDAHPEEFWCAWEFTVQK